jgi:hypothetical protein
MRDSFLALAHLGANHATKPGTYEPDGFARALCRSTLWVSVEHDAAGQPIPAADDDLSCARCRKALAKSTATA